MTSILKRLLIIGRIYHTLIENNTQPPSNVSLGGLIYFPVFKSQGQFTHITKKMK